MHRREILAGEVNKLVRVSWIMFRSCEREKFPARPVVVPALERCQWLAAAREVQHDPWGVRPLGAEGGEADEVVSKTVNSNRTGQGHSTDPSCWGGADVVNQVRGDDVIVPPNLAPWQERRRRAQGRQLLDDRGAGDPVADSVDVAAPGGGVVLERGDRDHGAAVVDDRAAAVARVEGGVNLDHRAAAGEALGREVGERRVLRDCAACQRGRARDAWREADRRDAGTDGQVGSVQLQGLDGERRRRPQQGQIVIGQAADHSRRDRVVAVHQLHRGLVLDHVLIGEPLVLTDVEGRARASLAVDLEGRGQQSGGVLGEIAGWLAGLGRRYGLLSLGGGRGHRVGGGRGRLLGRGQRQGRAGEPAPDGRAGGQEARAGQQPLAPGVAGPLLERELESPAIGAADADADNMRAGLGFQVGGGVAQRERGAV